MLTHAVVSIAQSLELDPHYADARTWYRKVTAAMVRVSSVGQTGESQWQRSAVTPALQDDSAEDDSCTSDEN